MCSYLKYIRHYSFHYLNEMYSLGDMNYKQITCPQHSMTYGTCKPTKVKFPES